MRNYLEPKTVLLVWFGLLILFYLADLLGNFKSDLTAVKTKIGTMSDIGREVLFFLQKCPNFILRILQTQEGSKFSKIF